MHATFADSPCLLTTVTYERRPYLSYEPHARAAVEQLYHVHERHPFALFAFIVLPDCCHVLLAAQSPGTVSDMLHAYTSGLSSKLRLSPLWQGEFHVQSIRSITATKQALHMQPVDAGLVASPEEFPWSSASRQWDVQDTA